MSKIIDLNIEETAQHKRAFSLYSSLNPELSASEREFAVAERLSDKDVSADDIKTWSSMFHWEERAAQDAQVVQKGLDARSRKEKLREKVEGLADKIFKALDDKDALKNVTIDDGKTLSQLAGALDKLVHTICVLDGTAVDTLVIRNTKPISDWTDEELAAAQAEGRARVTARAADEGPEAA